MKSAVQEKLKELMPLLPKTPQEDAISILQRRGYLKKDILVYRVAYQNDRFAGKKTKVVQVTCSACGTNSYMEYSKFGEESCRYTSSGYGFIDPADRNIKCHGDTCICPACGKGMKAIHIDQFKAIYEVDNKCFLTLHNVDGHLAVLEWIANKYVRRDGTVFYGIRGYEGVVVVAGAPIRVVKFVKFMSSYSWLDEWEYRKKFTDELYGWDETELIGWRCSTVEKSNCANSALVEYMRSGATKKNGAFPARYLQTWLRHPNVENLVRQGYSRYVSSVLTSSTVIDNYYSNVFQVSQTKLYVNWKEVKPLKMLGLDKSEIEIAKSCTMEELLLYRKIRDARGVKLTAAQIRDIGYDNKHFIGFAMKDVNGYRVQIIRTLNYLIRQKKMHKGDLVGAKYLLDYWNMLFKVYGSMVESELFPRDLVLSHDAIMERVQEKESAELQVKFDKRCAEMERFAFYDEESGLIIRVCKSQIEMINEGKRLVHCVGSYAKMHADGSTTIFFIRKMSALEEPYYTLEYKHGRVVQNRGYKNCGRTEEIKAFEQKWFKYIEKIKAKGSKKIKAKGETNGKHDRNESVRAGA